MTDKIKYLGISFQDDLTWDNHHQLITKKLQRAIGILSKIRHYVPKWLLRTIYFSLFNSHLIYGCEVWRQKNTALFRKIQELQDKTIRIINFKPDEFNVNELYKSDKILKISDFINLKNTFFVKDTLETTIPTKFHDYFTLARNIHEHGTRNARRNLVDIPQVRAQTYGHFSIKSRCAATGNTMQTVLNKDITQIAYSDTKKCIVQHFLDSYTA